VTKRMVSLVLRAGHALFSFQPDRLPWVPGLFLMPEGRSSWGTSSTASSTTWRG